MAEPKDDLLQPLAALVVKDRVGLGGLATTQQLAALALVWAGLPDAVISEPAINAQLKVQLAGPSAWLATDHVELRRWLVDAGWLQRDGFGREYRRTPRAGLRPAQAPWADALAVVDTVEWVAGQRRAHAAARDARRQAWVASEYAAGAAKGAGR